MDLSFCGQKTRFEEGVGLDLGHEGNSQPTTFSRKMDEWTYLFEPGFEGAGPPRDLGNHQPKILSRKASGLIFLGTNDPGLTRDRALDLGARSEL